MYVSGTQQKLERRLEYICKNMLKRVLIYGPIKEENFWSFKANEELKFNPRTGCNN